MLVSHDQSNNGKDSERREEEGPRKKRVPAPRRAAAHRWVACLHEKALTSVWFGLFLKGKWDYGGRRGGIKRRRP